LAVAAVVPQSAYAALRGWSRQYVHELVRDGKLTAPAVTPERKINIAEADRQIAAQRDPTKGPMGRPATAPTAEPMLPLVGELAQPALAGAGPAHGTLAAAKLTVAQNQALLTELQVAKARGELVEVAAATRAVELAASACLEILSRLGDDAVDALRGAATSEDARRAWRKLQALAQQQINTEATRRFREAMADA
jgi:hypothetical protein